MLAALTLAACGDDEESGGDGSSDGGPGDTLAIGETGTVGAYSLDDPTATEPVTELAVTVLGVREGTQEELDAGGFSLDPEEEATIPRYVDVSFENTGDAEVENQDLRSVSGEDPDEVSIPALTIISLGGPAFQECKALPEGALAPGATVEGCEILLVPEGTELDRLSYFPGGAEDFVYWDVE